MPWPDVSDLISLGWPVFPGVRQQTAPSFLLQSSGLHRERQHGCGWQGVPRLRLRDRHRSYQIPSINDMIFAALCFPSQNAGLRIVDMTRYTWTTSKYIPLVSTCHSVKFIDTAELAGRQYCRHCNSPKRHKVVAKLPSEALQSSLSVRPLLAGDAGKQRLDTQGRCARNYRVISQPTGLLEGP